MINCFLILFLGKHVYLLLISRHFCIKFQNFTEVIDERENATHQVDTLHVERNIMEQGKIRKRKRYLKKMYTYMQFNTFLFTKRIQKFTCREGTKNAI